MRTTRKLLRFSSIHKVKRDKIYLYQHQIFTILSSYIEVQYFNYNFFFLIIIVQADGCILLRGQKPFHNLINNH